MVGWSLPVGAVLNAPQSHPLGHSEPCCPLVTLLATDTLWTFRRPLDLSLAWLLGTLLTTYRPLNQRSLGHSASPLRLAAQNFLAGDAGLKPESEQDHFARIHRVAGASEIF